MRRAKTIDAPEIVWVRDFAFAQHQQGAFLGHFHCHTPNMRHRTAPDIGVGANERARHVGGANGFAGCELRDLPSDFKTNRAGICRGRIRRARHGPCVERDAGCVKRRAARTVA
jgi:hypothetical protein